MCLTSTADHLALQLEPTQRLRLTSPDRRAATQDQWQESLRYKAALWEEDHSIRVGFQAL